ncbi:MAG: methyl-accepting chemotaxis protein [Bacteroidota bacterium]
MHWEKILPGFIQRSIKGKILSITSFFFLILIAAFSVSTYYNEKQILLKSVDDKLLACAHAVNFMYGADFHEKIVSDTSLTQDEYMAIVRKLTSLSRKFDLAYVYTMVLDGDSVRFASTSMTEEEEKKGEPSPFFMSYPEATESLFRVFRENKLQYEEASDQWGTYRSICYPVTMSNGKVFVIGADMFISDLNEILNKALFSSLLIGFGVLVVFIMFMYFFTTRLSRPVTQLTAFAKKIAGENYSEEIKVESADETQILAGAMNKMLRSVKAAMEELRSEKEAVEQKVEQAVADSENGRLRLARSVEVIKNAQSQVAAGNLRVRLKVEENGVIGELFTSFNSTVESIAAMVGEVSSAVKVTVKAAQDIHQSSEQMAHEADEESKKTIEVAGAIEQMTKTILESTANTARASESAASASENALKSVGILDDTKKGMSRIVDAARQTGQKINSLTAKIQQIEEMARIIDDIANQTNLLALNAAIEAARAGEQGRGFAVVADEVKKLAERTTSATKEIAGNLKAIREEAQSADESMQQAEAAVGAGMELTRQVENSLNEISAGNQNVKDMIGQIAASSEEQSATASEISRNIEGISTILEHNAVNTRQIAETADELNDKILTLQKLISRFNSGAVLEVR